MRRFLILFVLLCTSCGTAIPTIKPYKLDVQQGNAVTSKMLLQLRPGMTKSQVRFIMGTPLIQDSFHGNRWDYVYQMRESGKVTEQRRVILDFENELLKTVRGDVVASGVDKNKATEPASDSGIRVINPSAKPAEKGILNKLKFWEKDDATLAKEAAAKAKAEADETAKKATENAAKESATPVKESKSILAVPLDVMPDAEPEAPVVIAPVIEGAPAAETPKKPEPAIEPPTVESIKIEMPKVEPVKIEVPKVEPVKIQQVEANVTPTKPSTVNSDGPQKTLEKEIVDETHATGAFSPLSSYESTAGMKFDRALKITDGADSALTQEVSAPRAGNKTVPKPKELPAESKPSLFDRMLEKIGF
jgi:outer membrane protein assembly factor BamE